MSILGNRLKQLQLERRILKKDIANALGISTVGYYRYETGQHTPPTEMIVNISRFFNVSTDFLLGLSNDPTIHDPVIDEESAALEQAIYTNERIDLPMDQKYCTNDICCGSV
jgi:transcriptional regulator with XRE-family HTH domain